MKHMMYGIGGLVEGRVMAKTEIPIIMAADSTYLPYAAVSICSMIDTKGPESIYKIHVLHTGSELAGTEHLLSLARPDITISLCNAEYLLAPYMNHLYSRAHFSKEMYFRWWIGELFPEYDKALYLDCDTVVCRDLAELYQEDLQDAAVAGVVDFATPAVCHRISGQLGLSAKQYINSGVLLVNAAVWRSDHLAEACVSKLQRYDILACPDQDILNLICKDRILYLNGKWNVQWQHFWDEPDNCLQSPFRDMFFEAVQDPGIIHFTSPVKPWNHPMGPYTDLFWHYAAQLPFFRDISSSV